MQRVLRNGDLRNGDLPKIGLFHVRDSVTAFHVVRDW